MKFHVFFHRATYARWLFIFIWLLFSLTTPNTVSKRIYPSVELWFKSLYSPVEYVSLNTPAFPIAWRGISLQTLSTWLARLCTTLAIFFLFKMMQRQDNSGALPLACISAFASNCFGQLSHSLSPITIAFFVHSCLLYLLSGGGYRFRYIGIGTLLSIACILQPTFFIGTFIFLHLIYVRYRLKAWLQVVVSFLFTFVSLIATLPHYSLFTSEVLFIDPIENFFFQGWNPSGGMFWVSPFLFFGVPALWRVIQAESNFHLYLCLFIFAQMSLFAIAPRYHFHSVAFLESFILYPYLLVFLHLQWRLLLQKKRLRILFFALVLYSFYMQFT